MKVVASLLIALSTLSVSAFAADTGTGKIHLDSAVKVGSTQLPAGDYKVKWNASGDNAQVTLTQGKTSATTNAQVLDVKRAQDGVGTKTENGARVLTEIQFRDKTLVFQPATGTVAGQ